MDWIGLNRRGDLLCIFDSRTSAAQWLTNSTDCVAARTAAARAAGRGPVSGSKGWQVVQA